MKAMSASRPCASIAQPPAEAPGHRFLIEVAEAFEREDQRLGLGELSQRDAEAGRSSIGSPRAGGQRR
jgi:hypothetical protein